MGRSPSAAIPPRARGRTGLILGSVEAAIGRSASHRQERASCSYQPCGTTTPCLFTTIQVQAPRRSCRVRSSSAVELWVGAEAESPNDGVPVRPPRAGVSRPNPFRGTGRSRVSPARGLTGWKPAMWPGAKLSSPRGGEPKMSTSPPPPSCVLPVSGGEPIPVALALFDPECPPRAGGEPGGVSKTSSSLGYSPRARG